MIGLSILFISLSVLTIFPIRFIYYITKQKNNYKPDGDINVLLYNIILYVTTIIIIIAICIVWVYTLFK
jgi:cell division protein FtsX